MKKVLSLLLALVLIFSLCAVPSYAASKTFNVKTDGIYDGESKCRTISDKITIQPGANFAGTEVSTTYVIDAENAADVSLSNQTRALIGNSKGSYLNISGFLSLKKDGTPRTLSDYSDVSPDILLSAGLGTTSYTPECDKYYYLCFKLSDDNIFGLLVQIKGKLVDRSALKTAIDSALPTSGYYTENDRWNGKITSKSVKGFWQDLKDIVDAADKVYKDENATQDRVNDALAALNAALPGAKANLIPLENVNATALYEALHADWRWYYNELRLNEGAPVSKENCTALTWDAYTQAKIDGQALLDELYDADGKPVPSVNTSDRNDEVNAAAAAADGHKLVNKDAYDSAYEAYQSGKAEAETLIKQYDPAKLNESDYSAGSWKAFTDAYAALKADLDYRIVGGSTEAYAMLKDFTKHVTVLKNTRKQLVSDKDITISFTYLNNFSAQFENFRENGTNLYVNAELSLTKGKATLADAIEAAGLVLDRHDDQTIPGGASNNSDTLPWLMLFVNGNNYGLLQERLLNDYQVIQLHDSDVVRLIRICQPLAWTEASTGYDSTAVTLGKTFDEQHYRDSIAKIDMTAPAASKVGAKTAVSATVTGANATNLGKTLNPKNVTLFISDPTDEKTLSQPIYQTTATTDESGNLQYVFREPGYYTIAAFNVEPDDYGTTTVYNAVTAGEYHSLYAGDYALIYVAEADNPAAVMAQYRTENLAQAKAYYEQFHDYDFTADDYAALKSAYETLKAHLQSAATFKELMDQFDEDFAALQIAGAKAIDHAAVISALREKLSYMPEDLNDLNTGDRELVEAIQTAYSSVRTNTYEKTLLTAKETSKLEQIFKLDAAKLPAQSTVTVKLIPQGDFLSATGDGDTGAAQYGEPNQNKITHTYRDGHIDTSKRNNYCYWYDEGYK